MIHIYKKGRTTAVMHPFYTILSDSNVKALLVSMQHAMRQMTMTHHLDGAM